MIVIIRGGEQPRRLPLSIINGQVRGPKGELLIDSQVIGFEARREEITALLKARKFDAVPVEFIAVPGANPSGLIVMDANEYDRKQRAEYAASHPGAEERRRIHQMYHRISGDYRYSEEADGGLYYKLKADADAALAAWREEYPREAAEEDALALEAKAASIEDNYCDLDGSLSREDIDRLNAERESKRQVLRKQAAEIRERARI